MNRKLAIAGIVVLTGCAAPVVAYWACFALWMTAYYRADGPPGAEWANPGALRSWQLRFYFLLASLLAVGVTDFYLLIKVIRDRRSRKAGELR